MTKDNRDEAAGGGGSSNINNVDDENCQNNSTAKLSGAAQEVPNFWEINRYRFAVKRIDDGYRRCSDLTSFLQDRSDCEKSFARQLRSCSRRWAEILQLERGAECGSTLNAWTAFLSETDRTAEIHATIADRLREVVEHVKAWQKNNYNRGMISNRTVREYDDEFKKAQKSWAKIYTRMMKCKKDYYSACKAMKTAENQKDAIDRQIQSSSGTQQSNLDARRKILERLERSVKEKSSCEQKYRSSIEELEHLMPLYIEQMSTVFEKTQTFERERLRFFKEVFKGTHTSLDISKSAELAAIYDELSICIDGADAEADIDWWARTYGAKMPMQKPQFIEFVENPNNLVPICRKTNPAPPHPGPARIGFTRIMDQISLADYNSSTMPLMTSTLYPDANNPFRDEIPPDGVPVRAIYDYVAQESDELSLRAGMQFYMIEERDEQGWCKGRHGSKEGLYPASYATSI
ncbi:hypothetical protein ACOME3_008940 [Neoechinorhynchus agilis]